MTQPQADSREILKKYKALAEEYARLRQDASILKRAVLDERSRSSDLEAALKARDGELKVLAEANERYKFNNEKLSKRVLVLQQSLDEATKVQPPSSSWFSSSTSTESSQGSDALQQQLRVTTEELNRKNRENAKLHMDIYSVKQEAQQTVDTLNVRLQKMKDEYDDKENTLRGELMVLESSIIASKDKEEYIRKKFERLEREYEETKRELTKKELEVDFILHESSSSDSTSRRIVSRQLLVDDSTNDQFSSVNAPSPDIGGDSGFNFILEDGGDLTLKLLSASQATFEEFQKRFEAVSKSSPLDPHLALLCQKLLELSEVLPGQLNSMQKLFHDMLLAQSLNSPEGSAKKAKFSESLSRYVDARQKYTLAFQLYTLEEIKLRSTKSAQMKLKALHDALGTVQSQLERVSVSIGLLCEVEKTLKTFVGSFSLTERQQNLKVILGHISESMSGINQVGPELIDGVETLLRSENDTSSLEASKWQHLQETVSSETKAWAAVWGSVQSAISYISEPPAKPTRGVFPQGQAPKSAVSLQRKSARSLALFNAQKPHFHLPYDQQSQSVQLIETLNRTNADSAVEISKLSTRLLYVEAENQELFSKIDQSNVIIASKDSLIQSLGEQLQQTKTKLDENTSIVNHLRSVNAKMAEQNVAPSSPRGPPSPVKKMTDSLPPKRNPVEAPKKIEKPAPPPTQPVSVPTVVVPSKKEPSPAAPSSHNPFDIPKASSSSYNPFDDSKPSTDPSSYNPFESFETSASAPRPEVSASPKTYNPFDAVEAKPVKQESIKPVIKPLPLEVPKIAPPQSEWQTSVLDQDGQEAENLDVPVKDLEREIRLKEHYESTVAQLSSQIRMSDSKSLDLFNRQQKLEKLVKAAKDERDAYQKKFEAAEAKMLSRESQEEAVRAKNEAEVHTLTEHIVKLNEMSAKYEEELEQIRSYKVRCGKCKAWNTVGWLLTEGQGGKRCSNGDHASSFNFA